MGEDWCVLGQRLWRAVQGRARVRSEAGEGGAGSRAQEEGSLAGAHGLHKGRAAESKSGEQS